MKKTGRFNRLPAYAISLIFIFNACGPVPELEGTLHKWQPVILTFTGPYLAEESSTFRDYRLNVVFTHEEAEFIVPGYFAADGNAANSSAEEGDKWRVMFSPDRTGEWSYRVSFRTGKDIAASLDPDAGEPIDPDGVSGKFIISETNPEAPGLYRKGALRYVGERYLQFGETGEWFVKAGPGAPENFLGYAEFDNTYNVEGGVVTDSMLGEDRLHNYEPHIRDWKTGDPGWKDGKGKGIIGAINYLSSKGINTQYMVTNNVNGDGRDCWPWTDHETRDVFDVSKMDQWDIVFTHMNEKGIHIDFLLWEAENTPLLNDGDMGIERKIYYREIIARFGHLPGIRWNISEEPQITPEQMSENIAFISQIEPYGQALGSHSGHTVERRESEYGPMLGDKNFDGAWMQVHHDHHDAVLKWVSRSEAAGHKWVVSVDESMAIYTFSTDTARQIFWDVVTAGGEGFDVYFGYGGGTCDIANEDYRNRDKIWTQLAIGVDFFSREDINPHLPEMKNHDELGNGHILAVPGEIYIIYLNEEERKLDLSGESGEYSIVWLDPQYAEGLQVGSKNKVSGGSIVSLGDPPGPGIEWVILVMKI